jgi:MFS family permease
MTPIPGFDASQPDPVRDERTAASHSAGTTPARTPKKAAVAAWVGSALEYYDFVIYGTAASLVFPHIFFPEGNPAAATVASLATFGVGYVARPIGSFLLGHMGDKFGRKKVLIFTLLLMGVTTFLVGCLPTYHSIGILAPILLVVLRLLQGLSAAGEQAGANSMSFEHAPDRRRGFFTSWTLSGTQGGQVLAPAVFLPLAALLSEDQLLSWGWRIPFFLSAIVVVVGFVIRRRLDETPAFESEVESHTVPRTPLSVLLRDHWRAVLRVMFAAFVAMVNTLYTVFALAFATKEDYGIGFSSTFMLWVAIISNLVAIAVIPFWGSVSDRVGRKPVFLGGLAGSAVLAATYVAVIASGNQALTAVVGILLAGIVYSATNAVWPSTYAEYFPTSVRLSGMAIGTQFGFALAGFTPTIAAALLGATGDGWPKVAGFAVVACLISAVAVATGPRGTHRVPTEQLGRKTPQRASAVAGHMTTQTSS